MGPPVRAVCKDRLESAVPRRLSICPCSATRTILVLFADERRGIFRVAPGADVYSLSSAGKSALRDSHRLGRQGHHRTEALASFTGSQPAGDACNVGSDGTDYWRASQSLKVDGRRGTHERMSA